MQHEHEHMDDLFSKKAAPTDVSQKNSKDLSEKQIDWLNQSFHDRNVFNNISIPFGISPKQYRDGIAAHELARISKEITQDNCDHSYASPPNMQAYDSQQPRIDHKNKN